MLKTIVRGISHSPVAVFWHLLVVETFVGAHQVDKADVEVLVRLHHSICGCDGGSCGSGSRSCGAVVVVGGGAAAIVVGIIGAVRIATAAR